MRKSDDQAGNQNCADPIASKIVMAFLQARMGSTRLPGKVLMKMRGHSILERAIRRLQAAPIVNDVAVLTTRRNEDDAIVAECRRLNVRVYRGPDEDVLARFCEASQKFLPDIIIRATADNPLIDIDSIERIVLALCSGGLDYCLEKDLPYGAATEAITVEALARVNTLAKESHHREHVTLYAREHPELFNLGILDPPEFLHHPEIRLTVDTAGDFAFVDQLIRRMPETEHPLPLGEYLPVAKSILNERECKGLADL